MSGRRFDAWFKVYPADLDLRFRMLSDEAKATYLDVLCLAHANDPYGFLPAPPRAAALIGRTELAFRTTLLALSETRLVANPSPDVFVVPQLVRDRQKAIAGDKSWAVRSARSERPFGTSVLSTQDSETQKNKGASPPAARARGGTDSTRLWDRLWAEHRGEPYRWIQADAVAVAKATKLAGGDLAELERRIVRLLTSTDLWLAQNASPRILHSRWNQLAVEFRPLSKAEKNSISTPHDKAVADLFRAVP